VKNEPQDASYLLLSDLLLLINSIIYSYHEKLIQSHQCEVKLYI